MAAVALKKQLNSHIASMFAAGLVDNQFWELLDAQEDGSYPGFVAEIVDLFVDDAKNIIDGIAGLLEQPVVDFHQVDELVHQLNGSSGSVGARKMKLICQQCRQFLVAKSRDGYLIALAIIRKEFTDISNKFRTMLQLEQKIAACS